MAVTVPIDNSVPIPTMGLLILILLYEMCRFFGTLFKNTLTLISDSVVHIQDVIIRQLDVYQITRFVFELAVTITNIKLVVVSIVCVTFISQSPKSVVKFTLPLYHNYRECQAETLAISKIISASLASSLFLST